MKLKGLLFHVLLVTLVLAGCKDHTNSPTSLYTSTETTADSSSENISTTPTQPGDPSVPTDNEKIAFVLNGEGTSDIATANPDGHNLTNLTNGIGQNGSPAWSPDGSRIAFSSTRDGTRQIYQMDPDGQNVIQLTSDYENDHPIWLPDNQSLAFLTTDGHGLWWWRILALNTGEIFPFTEPSYDFFFQTPAWSPDGQYLAYMSLTEQAERNDGSSQIHVRRLDGSEDIALTSDIWANITPIWSPDGSKIAFLSERDGIYSLFALYTVRFDGSGLTRYSAPVFSESTSFSWSPDGKLIAIADPFFGSGISILNLESLETWDLLSLDAGQSAAMPAWQP